MNTIQEQLATIKAANNIGNYAQAEELCRKLLAQELQPEEKATVLGHLSGSLWQRGFAKEALPLAQNALSLSQEVANKELQANSFGNIASIYTNLSDYPRALEYYNQALELYQELENKNGLVKIYCNIGIVYQLLSDYVRALEYYHQSLAISEQLGNQTGVLANLGNIGIVYEILSDYARALEYYLPALAQAKELGNKNTMAINLGNIGVVYKNLSDYPRSLEYLHQALTLNQELGNKSGEAFNLGNLGHLYCDLSDYSRASKYYHQALEASQELGDKSGVARHLSSIGTVYLLLSEHSCALKYYHQALELNQELGNKSGVAVDLGNIGAVYLELSDYPRSLEYLHQAITLHQELGKKREVAINLGHLGGIYAKPDFTAYNPIVAEDYLLQSLAINKELGTKHHLYIIFNSLADLYKQEGRWQEHAEYLQQYYDLRDEVQSEEAKKLADKFAFERQIAVMEKEREVTDMLLHKFLPSPIVNDVKAKQGKILVQKFESISVLFADLVGFTKLSLSIKPETMIEMLNFIFTKFDTIIKEAGGHRIRTMGDGYFAICGAPDRIKQHQYKLAKAALAMQEGIILPEHIRKHLSEGTELDIRIGLHCGEAVCGMVGGLEKWQYDAYGDTVNTASRMESHGEAGKIHVSEEFKNALVGYDEFTFTHREPMFIKGKGMMNTFFLS